MSRIRAYLLLTKPTIMLLVVITGASALVMEQTMLKESPIDCLLVLLALFLTGGAANGLNQFFERDIDAQMDRTRNRRPLPRGEITHRQALAFAVTIGTAGVALLALRFNALSAILGLVTIVFYGFFYTLWLKPNTAQNIVIGGAAGAMAPVIAWAAVANTVPTEPWLLFLIVFLWTPPHFWALALYRKADYERVNLPMMPVVAGDESTLNQMLWYTIALVVISLSLCFYGTGWLYLASALVLGGIFLQKMIVTRREKTREREINLFLYSIIYLLALFSVIILEGLTGLNQI